MRWLDATDQAELVRRGELTPGQLVDDAIGRIERVEPELGLLVDTRFDRARDEAVGTLPDGPFRGVPFLLKDAVQHSAGDRYQHGLVALRDHPWRSPADTELTRRYRAAGFVLLGRTKVPEFTMSTTTEPAAHGPARNPWDPTRSTGGSSGGSAGAVAAGLVPVAHGNDMGGSIRIPAAVCGLVGLKPSRYRTSLAPDLGAYWGPLTHEHVLTRSVRDSAAVLDASAGAVPGDLTTAPAPRRPWLTEVGTDPGPSRIGLLTERADGGAVDAVCAGAARDAATVLESLGHVVVPVDPGFLVDDEGRHGYSSLIAAGVAHDVAMWERRLGVEVTDVDPRVGTLVGFGRSMTGVDHVVATDALARWSRRIAAATADYDVVLTPTMACQTPPLGALNGTDPGATEGVAAMTAFVLPFDASGQPAISLPGDPAPDGMPVGVQFIAAYGGEDLLFRIAAQWETARPWADRHPPVR